MNFFTDKPYKLYINNIEVKESFWIDIDKLIKLLFESDTKRICYSGNINRELNELQNDIKTERIAYDGEMNRLSGKEKE
jgi:DUF1009 family protein